ncbi:putative polygalacturonase [Hibiscus syriacus]|uniref:Polygalacturonase n=1 Tax=Hibiscus syriacus TaxID=106335 RepID=A0A6A3A7A9_HIBSY|nr:putative polygalacturonase [Hibiscus syriacus]
MWVVEIKKGTAEWVKIASETARTILGRENGENCDVKNLSRGSKVYLRVFVEGANLSTGDMHFSQGDGEVSFCGAIEMSGYLELKWEIIRGGMKEYLTPMGPTLHATFPRCKCCIQTHGTQCNRLPLEVRVLERTGRISGIVDSPNAVATLAIPTCKQVIEMLISAILLLELLSSSVAGFRAVEHATVIEFPALNCRKHSAVLTDFGGVGDGKTSNTEEFKAAIANLSQLAADGGAQLVVPPGKWLTGSFNLTSHFTLFIHKDAVILGAQDGSEWPHLPVLPSYGRGRDAAGERFSSLIFGTNFTDVVITGNNGTVDGQGAYWWNKFKEGTLNSTRPYLIEVMYSNQIHAQTPELKTVL